MSEIRTLMYDPQSFNAQRCVFTIPKGMNVVASKIRVCDFEISNSNGDQIYFNHSGVYSLLQKVSILSLSGVEIDRLSNMEMMAIKLMHMENASQFAVNRQLSQNMCNSIYFNNLGQASLTEEYGQDDGSKMSIMWNISMMLSYLQRRTVIAEGFTILLEFATPDVVGFNYSFSKPPSLAIDEYLTQIPTEQNKVVSYTTIIQDKLNISQGESGFHKRLNSFYQQMLGSVYFFNVLNKESNPLINAVSKPDEKFQISIDGKQIIPLGGINTPSKKLGMLNDFSGFVNLPGYSSALELLNTTVKPFYNINNGLNYSNKFSYGCFLLNRYIGNDFTVDYSMRDPVDSAKGETLLVLAECMRAYDIVNDKVSFVGSPNVPSF